MQRRPMVYTALLAAMVAAACAAPPVAENVDADTNADTDTMVDTTDETIDDDSQRTYSVAEIGIEFGDAVWRVEVSACGVESGGSAFAIADDLLVTNEHVVTFDTEPTVISRDGRELSGRVIGMAPWVDIAVIEVSEPLGQQLSWRPAAELVEGQQVVSLGYPAPLWNFAVAPGTLLSFDVTDGERTAILSDEPSDFGSSGGPLMDTTGRVIGVVTEFSDDSAAQLTGLSYTYELLGEVIDEIIANPEQLETLCDGIEYGSDRDFDALWDLCADGRYWACDVLYEISPVGSQYEFFAETCGERIDTTEWCTDEFNTPVPENYGDDPYLDALWDLCELNGPGGPDACDELMMVSPLESRYDEFGFSCGDRFDSPVELCVDLDY